MTSTRQQVIDAIWGGTLPASGPDEIVQTYTAGGQKALNPSNISVCKLLRFAVGGGLWSNVHVHYPTATPTTRALIYVSGHGSDYTHNWITVGAALARGYIVAEIFMSGYLSQPGYPQSFPMTYTLPNNSTVSVTTHDAFSGVDSGGGSSLRVHLDAVFRVARWLRQAGGASRVGIAGHSGGGWTALIAGALDTSIDFVASIHGWCPIGASGEPARDYEQTHTALLASRSNGYQDYSAMIGSRRQLLVTGSLDPVFGASALGQSAINTMVTAIQATGANLAQSTFTAPNHDMTAAEATYVLDEFDALGCPNYIAPRRSTTLAICQDIARIVNLLAGYPARGTVAVAAVDLGAGTGRVDLSAQDYARLYDAAQVATLSGADQTIVAAQRGAFTSR